MNAEMKNIFNLEEISAAVDSALASYHSNHFEADAASLAAKREEILKSVLASRTKDKFLNSKENRAIRKAHVVEAATQNNVLLFQLKEKVRVPDAGHSIPFFLKYPSLAFVLEDLAKLVGLTRSVERQVTFAVTTEEVDADDTKLVYALSIQNPYDEVDSLVGKERALARFLNGQTVTFYHSTPKTTIHVDEKLRILLEKGVVEHYRKRFSL